MVRVAPFYFQKIVYISGNSARVFGVFGVFIRSSGRHPPLFFLFLQTSLLLLILTPKRVKKP